MSPVFGRYQRTDESKFRLYDICTTEDSSFIPAKTKFNGTEVSHSTSFTPGSVTSLNKNVLHLLSNRQSGISCNTNFGSEFSAIKSKEMSVSNCFSTVRRRECLFVKQAHDGKGLVSFWEDKKYNYTDIYYFDFPSELETKHHRSKRSLIQSMSRSSTFDSPGFVADMCQMSPRGIDSILFVSNNFNRKGDLSQARILSEYDSGVSISLVKGFDKYAYSCASNSDSKIFTVGTEKGAQVFRDRRFSYEISMLGNVTSVSLNDSGNTLYCGIENDRLSVVDLREPVIEGHVPDCVFYSPRGISEMKLLSDEKTMIVCDDTGLSKIDFNRFEPVLKYEGHSSFGTKSPLSIIEDFDMLCATGSDNLTRLWSISTGKLLHTIRPQISNGNVHSSLIIHENKWFVALLQKKKLFVVEPCITS